MDKGGEGLPDSYKDLAESKAAQQAWQKQDELQRNLRLIESLEAENKTHIIEMFKARIRNWRK